MKLFVQPKCPSWLEFVMFYFICPLIFTISDEYLYSWTKCANKVKLLYLLLTTSNERSGYFLIKQIEIGNLNQLSKYFPFIKLNKRSWKSVYKTNCKYRRNTCNGNGCVCVCMRRNNSSEIWMPSKTKCWYQRVRIVINWNNRLKLVLGNLRKWKWHLVICFVAD